MPTVRTIPVIAEDGGDYAHRFHAMFGRYESKWLGQACGCVRLVVGHAQSATDQEIEPPDPAFADNRQ